jgi:ketosteroid isomerase-like protein
MVDERVQRLEDWLAAYENHDREAMEESLAEDAVWHVGGTHRLSGDYRGREAILGYFDAVRSETENTMKLERLEVLANELHGSAFLHVTAEREGRTLDVVVADAFRFDPDGRILEFWAHANDQAAIDEFWS